MMSRNRSSALVSQHSLRSNETSEAKHLTLMVLAMAEQEPVLARACVCVCVCVADEIVPKLEVKSA